MLATLIVNSAADNITSGDGLVTLREAIIAANTDTVTDLGLSGFGVDTIFFAAADFDTPKTITLTIPVPLEITEDLTIDATPLADNVTIDANNTSRIFSITATTGDFTLAGLTLTGGRTTGNNSNNFPDTTFSGGAILSLTTGSLTIDQSTVSGNSTTGNYARGGGIFSKGAVTLTSSTVSGNSTEGTQSVGGGIRSSGAVTLTSSTVSGNSTAGSNAAGGGIHSYDAVTLTSSTVSGNSTAGIFADGGGILSGGDTTLYHSTVTDNRANYSNATSGGIRNFNDLVFITNSIVAGNTAGGGMDDIDPGTGFFLVNFSLIGDNDGTGLTEAPVGSSDINGNLIGGLINGVIDPLLDSLASNGGPTETHALLAGSPAIDTGNPLIVFNPAEFDQRGAPFVRVSDGGVAGVRIDMGAYERQTLAPSFLIVTTTTDELDYSNADVSLREAISSANGSIGTDTITFDAAVFATPQTITLGGTDLEITEDLTINGTALSQHVTIDADEQSRIFNITATSGNFTLAGLTLTGGRTTGDNAVFPDTTFNGGAVRSLTNGVLTIDQSTISGNSTVGTNADGGGIFSYGDVMLTSSTVSGNSTAGDSTIGGGGIRSSGTVTLTSSTVSGNSTAGSLASGGGIFSRGAVTLTSSTVSGNSTTGSSAADGGGIRSLGAVTLTSSTVSGNSTAGSFAFGGGIRADDSVTLTSSTVSGNSTAGNNADGGGIYSFGAVMLTSSTVSGNSTAGDVADGGGISSVGAVTLTSSTVSGNSTAGYGSDGGGISSVGDVTLTSSTVSGNSTAGDVANGGGIFSFGVVTLASSTVTDNHAYYSSATGGGIWNSTDPITITNSIVAGNTAGGGIPDIDPGTGTFSVNYSLIGSGITPDAGTSGNNVVTDSPLIGLLADNGGPTETHALLAGSLAIDMGDPAILFDVNEFDQRGVPFVRVFDDPTAAGTSIDMGAYERQTVAGLNLVVDTPIDENDGDYTTGDLSLREAVGLANGSIGDNTITFDAAVFATPQTILLGLGEIEISEALTIDATSLTSNVTIDAQQQSRIFHITAATGDFTLAGLNLTGGRTTGDSAAFATTFNGGAIRSLTLGNLTLDQSTVSGNSTTGIGADGGGIFSSTVTLTSSTVSGNSTAGDNADGGGIRSSTATLTSSTVSGNSTAGSFARGGGIRSGGAITLTSSTVSGNSTTGSTAEGGGISSGGAIMLTSSTVSGNSTTGYNADGGGVFSYRTVTLISSTVSGNSTMGNRASGGGISSNGGGFSDGAVTLISSTVSGNSTASSNAAGGGIFSDGAVSLTSSTVTDNQANGSTGGGIRNYNHPISITNSIVAGNTAGGGMNDINPGTGTFSVNYSLIGTGVSPDAGTSGTNAVTNNPMLGALADNGGPTETHALLAGSLALDMGDLAASPGVGNVPLFDQRGNNFGRVQNGRIDIGAFEVRETLSADFDTDGFITGFDFLLWQRGFGTAAPGATKPDGDADNDQDADGNDLDVWKSQFGQPAPAVATTSSLVVESSLAVEPSSAFQVEVTTALTSTSEESVASRLPDNFIVSPSDLGLGFRFTAPRQVLVRTKAITEHAFTEHVDEAFHGVWNSLPEQILEFASDDFVLATHGRSAKATQLADKAFAELADDEGFVGLVLPL